MPYTNTEKKIATYLKLSVHAVVFSSGSLRLRNGANYEKDYVMKVLRAVAPLVVKSQENPDAKKVLDLIMESNPSNPSLHQDAWSNMIGHEISHEVDGLKTQGPFPTGHTIKIAQDVLKKDGDTYVFSAEHIKSQIEQDADENGYDVNLTGFPSSYSLRTKGNPCAQSPQFRR